MLCSTVVEMRPGSKGELGNGAKALVPEKGSEQGQDLKITTVKFAELLKKLPNVKSEEEEEKENRAVTTKDLDVLLQELRALRDEVKDLKSSS
jgi:endonuclease IV